MARDNGMMNVLLIAGGGFALYYILNNYGPAGAVYNSSGQAVNQSYWDTWFGPSSLSTVNAAAAAGSTPATSLPTSTPATSLPASAVTPVSVYASPTTAPPISSGGGNTVYALMSSAASTNAFIQSTGGQADPYQWATLWNSAGQPAINVGSLFTPAQLAVGTPNAPGMSTQGIPLMSLTQFLSTLQSAGIQPNSAYGLSGMGNIVTLPSFNGGRGGFSGGFRGGFRGKPVVN